MVSYDRLGQLGPTVTWDDGELDAPDRVLSVCDACGALVVAAREADHSKTHEVSE